MLAASILQALGINFKVVALQALVFLALLWVLIKFLFAPVRQILAAREQEVKGHLDQARTQQAEAEKARADLQHRLETIHEEARQHMREAAAESKVAHDRALAEAREEAQKLLQRAASEIALEKRKAIAELREEVANLALHAASKALREDLDEGTQRRVVDRAIADLEAHQ